MTTMTMSLRKQIILETNDIQAESKKDWRARNAYFHDEDLRYLKFLIPEGLKVLDLGCGLGDVLAALKPSKGVGVDFSVQTLKLAQKDHPKLDFIQGDIEDPKTISQIKGTFDIILLSDTIGYLDDCQQTLSQLKHLCHPNTRIIISYFGRVWDPVLKCAEWLGLKSPQVEHNYLTTGDIANLLYISGFDVIKREWRQLLPKKLFGLGGLINKYIGTLPGVRRFCVRNYIIARPEPEVLKKMPSATVVITCRNEKGNVENAVKRLPQFCEDLEILFIEGHSKDGTLDEIHRVIKAYPKKNITVYTQDGVGKGDAVRKAFDKAKGDILIIMDGDLTTPPEDMPKFYQALVEGRGEFINGTRLVYPLENQAMQFLNFIANHGFSWIFSFLLNQRFTDTLCGTKVLYKKHYQEIAVNRHYFGDFDPFGDFDLIFGASKLNLKVTEIPVRYAARQYGETQISRFTHGFLLIRMVLFAYRKLKAF